MEDSVLQCLGWNEGMEPEGVQMLGEALDDTACNLEANGEENSCNATPGNGPPQKLQRRAPSSWPEAECQLERLADEQLLEILNNLQAKDLARMALSSRRLRKLALQVKVIHNIGENHLPIKHLVSALPESLANAAVMHLSSPDSEALAATEMSLLRNMITGHDLIATPEAEPRASWQGSEIRWEGLPCKLASQLSPFLGPKLTSLTLGMVHVRRHCLCTVSLVTDLATRCPLLEKLEIRWSLLEKEMSARVHEMRAPQWEEGQDVGVAGPSDASRRQSDSIIDDWEGNGEDEVADEGENLDDDNIESDLETWLRTPLVELRIGGRTGGSEGHVSERHGEENIVCNEMECGRQLEMNLETTGKGAVAGRGTLTSDLIAEGCNECEGRNGSLDERVVDYAEGAPGNEGLACTSEENPRELGDLARVNVDEAVMVGKSTEEVFSNAAIEREVKLKSSKEFLGGHSSEVYPMELKVHVAETQGLDTLTLAAEEIEQTQTSTGLELNGSHLECHQPLSLGEDGPGRHSAAGTPAEACLADCVEPKIDKIQDMRTSIELTFDGPNDIGERVQEGSMMMGNRATCGDSDSSSHLQNGGECAESIQGDLQEDRAAESSSDSDSEEGWVEDDVEDEQRAANDEDPHTRLLAAGLLASRVAMILHNCQHLRSIRVEGLLFSGLFEGHSKLEHLEGSFVFEFQNVVKVVNQMVKSFPALKTLKLVTQFHTLGQEEELVEPGVLLQMEGAPECQLQALDVEGFRVPEYTSLSFPKLTRLKLHRGIVGSSLTQCRKFLLHCPELIRLDLDIPIDCESIDHMARMCPLLSTVHLRHSPQRVNFRDTWQNLEELYLGGGGMEDNNGLKHVFLNCPKLKRAEVTLGVSLTEELAVDCPLLDTLKVLNYGLDRAKCSFHCPSLQHLSLQGLDPGPLDAIGRGCPNLKDLEVCCQKSRHVALGKDFRNLKKATVGGLDVCRTFQVACPKLESLTVFYTWLKATPPSVDIWGPRITELDFRGRSQKMENPIHFRIQAPLLTNLCLPFAVLDTHSLGSNCPNLLRLQVKHVANGRVSFGPAFQNLCILKIGDVEWEPSSHSSNSPPLSYLDICCPQLISLSCGYTKPVSRRDMIGASYVNGHTKGNFFRLDCPRLVRLDLGFYPLGALDGIATGCPCLEELRMIGPVEKWEGPSDQSGSWQSADVLCKPRCEDENCIVPMSFPPWRPYLQTEAKKAVAAGSRDPGVLMSRITRSDPGPDSFSRLTQKKKPSFEDKPGTRKQVTFCLALGPRFKRLSNLIVKVVGRRVAKHRDEDCHSCESAEMFCDGCESAGCRFMAWNHRRSTHLRTEPWLVSEEARVIKLGIQEFWSDYRRNLSDSPSVALQRIWDAGGNLSEEEQSQSQTRIEDDSTDEKEENLGDDEETVVDVNLQCPQLTDVTLCFAAGRIQDMNLNCPSLTRFILTHMGSNNSTQCGKARESSLFSPVSSKLNVSDEEGKRANSSQDHIETLRIEDVCGSAVDGKEVGQSDNTTYNSAGPLGACRSEIRPDYTHYAREMTGMSGMTGTGMKGDEEADVDTSVGTTSARSKANDDRQLRHGIVEAEARWPSLVDRVKERGQHGEEAAQGDQCGLRCIHSEALCENVRTMEDVDMCNEEAGYDDNRKSLNKEVRDVRSLPEARLNLVLNCPNLQTFRWVHKGLNMCPLLVANAQLSTNDIEILSLPRGAPSSPAPDAQELPPSLTYTMERPQWPSTSPALVTVMLPSLSLGAACQSIRELELTRCCQMAPALELQNGVGGGWGQLVFGPEWSNLQTLRLWDVAVESVIISCPRLQKLTLGVAGVATCRAITVRCSQLQGLHLDLGNTPNDEPCIPRITAGPKLSRLAVIGKLSECHLINLLVPILGPRTRRAHVVSRSIRHPQVFEENMQAMCGMRPGSSRILVSNCLSRSSSDPLELLDKGPSCSY